MTITKRRRLTKAQRQTIEYMDAAASLDQMEQLGLGDWCPMYDGEEEHDGEGDEPSDEGEGKGFSAQEEEEAPPIPYEYAKWQIVDGQDKTFFRSFGSVLDFCRQPFTNPENEKLFNLEQNNGEFDDYTANPHLREGMTNEVWYGAKTAGEAMNHAIHGWPAGAERIRKMMDSIDAPPPVNVKRKLTRGDQGDELDIHAVYRGGLDQAWSRRRRHQARGRMSVRLVVHLGGSKHMQSEPMFWRGAAAVKATELLEEAGYRVELIAVDFHCSMDSGGFFTDGDPKLEGQEINAYGSMIVKDSGQSLDIEQVAGVVCNAGFFRTFGFRSAYAMMEHTIRPTIINGMKTLKDGSRVVSKSRFISRCHVGMGNVTELGKLADDGTLTIEVRKSIETHDSAERWVRETIAKVDQPDLVSAKEDDDD